MLSKEGKEVQHELEKISYISFLNRKNLERRIYKEIKDQSVNALEIFVIKLKIGMKFHLEKEKKKKI